MPLGMEVDLGPVHIVLDGDTAPLPKTGAEPQIFGPSLLWPNGTAAPPTLFGPCLLWPRLPISATAELLLRFYLFSPYLIL